MQATATNATPVATVDAMEIDPPTTPTATPTAALQAQM
jgi:hypothetical protein